MPGPRSLMTRSRARTPPDAACGLGPGGAAIRIPIPTGSDSSTEPTSATGCLRPSLLGLEPVIAFTAGTATIDDPVPDSTLDQRKYYCGVYWTLWGRGTMGNAGRPRRGLERARCQRLPRQSRRRRRLLEHRRSGRDPGTRRRRGRSGGGARRRDAVDDELRTRGRLLQPAEYLNDYISALDSEPAYWSFHDYDDVTAGGAQQRSPYAGNLQAFSDILVGRYGPAYSAPIWITEAGGRLDQPNILEPDRYRARVRQRRARLVQPGLG